MDKRIQREINKRQCALMADFVHETRTLAIQTDNPMAFITTVLDTVAEGLVREVLYGGNSYTLDALEDCLSILEKIHKRVATDKAKNKRFEADNDFD